MSTNDLLRSALSVVSDGANRQVSESQSLLSKGENEPPLAGEQPFSTRSLPGSDPLSASNSAVMSAQIPLDLSQLARSPDSSPAAEQLGREDFSIERLEFYRRSADGGLHDFDPQVTDQLIADAWLSLDAQYRSFVIDRAICLARETQSTLADMYLKHWAFWYLYYEKCFETLASVQTRHSDLESCKTQFQESLALWKTESASSRKQWMDEISQHALAARESVVGHARFSAHSSPSPDPNTIYVRRQQAPPPRPERKTPKHDGPANQPEYHSDLQDEPKFPNTAPIRLSMSDLFDGRTPEQLEKSVEKGVQLLDDIRYTLGEEPSEEGTQWLDPIFTVRSQAVRSKTVIGVVGATGAGKSSIINAILDEERLVATNCMRACTAVVTEISYNYQDGAPYKAEVEFITKEDWRRMLNILFQDLLDHSGQVSRECFNYLVSLMPRSKRFIPG